MPHMFKALTRLMLLKFIIEFLQVATCTVNPPSPINSQSINDILVIASMPHACHKTEQKVICEGLFSFDKKPTENGVI